MGHKEIGQRLGLFMFSEAVGSGLPIFLPAGEIVRQQMISFIREQQIVLGYQHVSTPAIANVQLYERSGHYPYYADTMFPLMQTDDENDPKYVLKPMNCPSHHVIFASQTRSYHDLPLRIAEFGTVHRFEGAGALNGMLRLREFCQDDSHIYCAPNQIQDEIINIFELVKRVFSAFGFYDFSVFLSFHDPNNKEKYGLDPQIWATAENDLLQAVGRIGVPAEIQTGEASFYGPKIDFSVKDQLGREWQLGTIQLDYIMAERFDLAFVDENNSRQRPVIVHRACFGSIERFLAILLESTDGALPIWLSPVQAVILPVSQLHEAYANKCKDAMISHGWRANVDASNETLPKRIKMAELNKIPYMLVVGDQETSSNTVAVRRRGIKQVQPYTLDMAVRLER